MIEVTPAGTVHSQRPGPHSCWPAAWAGAAVAIGSRLPVRNRIPATARTDLPRRDKDGGPDRERSYARDENGNRLMTLLRREVTRPGRS
ncbi:hypothetical protein GCM10018779_03870 [Streptomyces griseocarneus]|nr:hypothetical protein GCM10018779_03870 [Streptomyces griseocarneus]